MQPPGAICTGGVRCFTPAARPQLAEAALGAARGAWRLWWSGFGALGASVSGRKVESLANIAVMPFLFHVAAGNCLKGISVSCRVE